MMDEGVDSPCTRICEIEQGSGLCRGCYRTLAEISCWARYSSAEKLNLLATIAQRKSAPASSSGPQYSSRIQEYISCR